MMRYLLLASMLLTAVHSQDVQPPPKPNAVDPALGPLLELFKQTLLSSGRVEYGWARDADGKRVKDWQQITSVIVDARGCQARLHFDASSDGRDPTDHPTSLFFESMDHVEALTEQGAYDRMNPLAGRLKALAEGAYALVINDRVPPFLLGSLMFDNQMQANKVADAASRAAQICRATPVTVNSTAGAPDLKDTLHFVKDKLNDNGVVNYRGTYKNSDGSTVSTGPLVTRRMKDIAVDPLTCQVRFTVNTANDSASGFEEKHVVSFRRVERLEVSTEQDAINRRGSPNGSVYSSVPVVYRLSVIFPGNSGFIEYLQFSDEDIANRIAKAMNHAVELCGGGSKDPF
jgi:hypothetical protein